MTTLLQRSLRSFASTLGGQFATESPGQLLRIIHPDYRIRENDLKDYIEKEIQALPSKMRLVFEMSRKSNLTYNEIAEKLNVSENNVSKQINNALRILKTKLSIAIYFIILLNII